MFDFTKTKEEYEILQHGVIISDLRVKYHDKFLLFINIQNRRDELTRGDLVAILTPKDYWDSLEGEKMPYTFSLYTGYTVSDWWALYAYTKHQNIKTYEKGFYHLPVAITVNNQYKKDNFLLDTGGYMCHLTYRLWLEMGLQKILLLQDDYVITVDITEHGKNLLDYHRNIGLVNNQKTTYIFK
ncbi:MAG: hypothetical protein FWG63_12305 [Defluviitaleaceae bacterium]|nr:hypothetical protein [Defluviitaleaceae bacterium]